MSDPRDLVTATSDTTVDTTTNAIITSKLQPPAGWQNTPRWRGKPPKPKGSWTRQQTENMAARRALGDPELARKWQARVDGKIIGPRDWTSGSSLVIARNNGSIYSFPVEQRPNAPGADDPKYTLRLRPSHVRVLGWFVVGHLVLRTKGVVITHRELAQLVDMSERQVGELVRGLVEHGILACSPTFERYGKLCNRRASLYRLTELAVMRFAIPVPRGVKLAGDELSAVAAALAAKYGAGTPPGPASTPAPAPSDRPIRDRKKLPSNDLLPTGVNPDPDARPGARAELGTSGAFRDTAAVASAGQPRRAAQPAPEGARFGDCSPVASSGGHGAAAAPPLTAASGRLDSFLPGSRRREDDDAERARDRSIAKVEREYGEPLRPRPSSPAPCPTSPPRVPPRPPATTAKPEPAIASSAMPPSPAPIWTDEDRAAARELAEKRKRQAMGDAGGMDPELAKLIEGACTTRFGAVPAQVALALFTTKHGGGGK